METILKTEHLTKRYGNKVAVDAVSMTMERGDIYGFIGKNGAGKTTTMRLLLGMSFADSGSITLFGTGELDKARHRIGALIEAPGLYKNCTAYENMKRFSILYGGADREIRRILALGAGQYGQKRRRGNSRSVYVSAWASGLPCSAILSC